MKKIVDTNVLLDHPGIVKEPNIVVPMVVLRELDRLKTVRGDVSQKARIASGMLRKYKQSIDFDGGEESSETADDYIVTRAKAEDWTVITEDIIVELKCQANGVHCESYGDKCELNGIYYLYVPDDNEVISQVYTNTYTSAIHENEYICIKDKEQSFTRSNGDIDYVCVDILQYKNGVFKQVIDKIIKSEYGEIRGLNPEQKCLINSLFDKDVSIVYAGGTWGVGKSFLIVNYALQQLEKGKINKIVFVPNNAVNENTRDPGILPGDLFQKESAFMGTLMDILHPEIVENMYFTDHTLEIMPISLARGRNLESTIIIVNEAQNLTDEHVKLLIARCGKDTKICFDGDFRQADSHIFRSKSGLKLLLQLKESEEFAPIFSSVNLLHTERSLTAQAATYLDEIEY